MFRFFKCSTKEIKEPIYSEEGKVLFKLLSKNEEWQLTAENTVFNERLKIFVRNHYNQGFYWSIQVTVPNEPYGSGMFTLDDQCRLSREFNSLVNNLKSKKVREILLKEVGCLS